MWCNCNFALRLRALDSCNRLKPRIKVSIDYTKSSLIKHLYYIDIKRYVSKFNIFFSEIDEWFHTLRYSVLLFFNKWEELKYAINKDY